MQKISFNDHYGLSKAVLNGKKTMTRRVIKDVSIIQHLNELEEDDKIHTQNADIEIIKVKIARYKLGEVVAVAQNYNDAAKEAEFNTHDEALSLILLGKQREKGWTNKLFVKPDLMPHQIQITGVRIERLQAISDDDCLKEGIKKSMWMDISGKQLYGFGTNEDKWTSPRETFAALINRPGVGRKGLWESNPWVICYSFKLVK